MINCRSVVKTKLPIAAAVKIGLRGNWVLRILTIILLSVAFAILTMITTFYTGNYRSSYISSIENSYYYHTGFEFEAGNKLFGDKLGRDIECMGQEFIDFIEAETPERKYVYQLNRSINIANLRAYSPVYDTGAEVFFNDLSRYVYAEDEAAYEQLGFEVMAGRYPQSPYEIAISDYQYELFKEYGYRDASAGFYYSDDDRDDRFVFFNKDLVESEKEEINSPEDLIGKPIVMYGDVEDGVLNQSSRGRNTYYFGKIVGVIDTHYDEAYDYYIKKFTDYGYEYIVGAGPETNEAVAKVFVAKELVEVYSPGGDYLSDIMYTTKAKDRGEAKELVEADYAVRDYIRALVEEKRAAGETVDVSESNIERAGLREHFGFDNRWQNDFEFLIILVPAALLFGVFAVVLIVHLARATLNEKQRQIGVLRALGCGQDSIRRVVWSEQLLIAGAALAVTLISTYTLFCLWWERYFTAIASGVPRAFFNGWNVLIIGALMIGMPLLATAGPLRKAGRRTIASQLSDPTERNRTGKKKRASAVACAKGGRASAPISKREAGNTQMSPLRNGNAPIGGKGEKNRREKKRAGKRASFPLSSSLKIGLRSIFERPARLCSVVFLAVFALMMFGISMTMALYDEDEAKVQSLYQYENVILFADSEGRIDDADLQAISSGTDKAFGTFTNDTGLLSWENFFVALGAYGNEEDCLRRAPQSMVYASREILEDAGIEVIGRMPEKKDEIMICRCMLNTLLSFGYYDEIASPKVYDEERMEWVYDENCLTHYASAEELIQANCRLLLSDPTSGGRIEATIVGVADYECPYRHVSGGSMVTFDFYDTIYVSEEYIREFCFGELGDYAIGAKASSVAQAQQLLSFSNERYALQSLVLLSVEEYRPTIVSFQRAFLWVSVGAAVFAAALIFQFISFSIRQRLKQIGILRALGGTPNDIFRIFFSESFILAVVYAVLAVPMVQLGSYAVNQILKNYFSIMVSVLNFQIAVPFAMLAVSVCITLFASFVPIYRAVKRTPTEYIRENEI